MRLPPYGKQVAQAPLGYWERGTRVLVFAGPRAWDFCRGWLDVDTFRLPQARHRYTLICPPDVLANADTLRWPVAERDVVIVQCGGDVEGLQALIAALQRDGCAGGEVFDLLGAPEHPLGWEYHLRAFQPWGWAQFDGEVMATYRRAVEAEEREAAERYVEAWCDRVLQTPGAPGFVESCPKGSLGAEVARRLALRVVSEAA